MRGIALGIACTLVGCAGPVAGASRTGGLYVPRAIERLDSERPTPDYAEARTAPPPVGGPNEGEDPLASAVRRGLYFPLPWYCGTVDRDGRRP